MGGLLTDKLNQLVHVPELDHFRVRNIDSGPQIHLNKNPVKIERINFHLIPEWFSRIEMIKLDVRRDLVEDLL